MINVYTTYLENIEKHDIYVLIDTLRATSTISTLLHCKIKSLEIVESLEKAFLKKNKILIGERNAQKIKGFDYSNSPVEILKNKEKLNGKEIVLTTTNGAKAFNKISSMGKVIPLSLLNLNSVYEYVKDYTDIGIVCSGSNGVSSLEDLYTAGLFLRNFKDVDLNDGAKIALSIANLSVEEIKNSDHARTMKRLNLNEDIKFCFKLNVFNEVIIME
ncbi:putative 2-phosphosulfolactate phosphatase [Tepiditoga spiralis]|uniref:Probable 2-phosphosulfolactate phosphatase n=1 Tax=Tepiditoga spiralis TaxID=2108365 RepID=A0A7G1GAH9_9BACT|nr:2-phosphosulfolactate phosphatase [Tepiditoga spiralis]BBE30489.1 putative 2-phosphosulfolactate phosphatase [Tepiditoga spiralis]